MCGAYSERLHRPGITLIFMQILCRLPGIEHLIPQQAPEATGEIFSDASARQAYFTNTTFVVAELIGKTIEELITQQQVSFAKLESIDAKL